MFSYARSGNTGVGFVHGSTGRSEAYTNVCRLRSYQNLSEWRDIQLTDIGKGEVGGVGNDS
jgi:hypothetical protein